MVHRCAGPDAVGRVIEQIEEKTVRAYPQPATAGRSLRAVFEVTGEWNPDHKDWLVIEALQRGIPSWTGLSPFRGHRHDEASSSGVGALRNAGSYGAWAPHRPSRSWSQRERDGRLARAPGRVEEVGMLLAEQPSVPTTSAPPSTTCRTSTAWCMPLIPTQRPGKCGGLRNWSASATTRCFTRFAN